MEEDLRIRRRGVAFVVTAQILLVVAALLAWTTRWSFPLLGVVATVPALPGLLDLRDTEPDPRRRLWLDRSFSLAVGATALAAVLVLVPYATFEDAEVQSTSLWAERGFAAFSLLVLGLGAAAWNAAAVTGLDGSHTARTLFAAHAATTVLAFFLVVTAHDGDAYTLTVRGQQTQAFDLTYTPLLCTAWGLLWAARTWPIRAFQGPQDRAL